MSRHIYEQSLSSQLQVEFFPGSFQSSLVDFALCLVPFRSSPRAPTKRDSRSVIKSLIWAFCHNSKLFLVLRPFDCLIDRDTNPCGVSISLRCTRTSREWGKLLPFPDTLSHSPRGKSSEILDWRLWTLSSFGCGTCTQPRRPWRTHRTLKSWGKRLCRKRSVWVKYVSEFPTSKSVNEPNKPVVLSQTRRRSRAIGAAFHAWQTQERIDVERTRVVEIFVVCHFHYCSIESVRMANRIEALFAQTLIWASRPSVNCR